MSQLPPLYKQADWVGFQKSVVMGGAAPPPMEQDRSGEVNFI